MNIIRQNYGIIFWILFAFIKNDTYSQEISLSANQKLPYNITSSIEIFRDTTAQLSLKQITSQKFKKNTKNHFIFPYSDDIFWVRFTLKNVDNHNKNWLLLWSNPLAEQLDLYVPDSTQTHFLHTQKRLITSERDKSFIDQDIRFSIDLAPQQIKTIYIKLTSKRGHYGSLQLHSQESFHQFRLNDYSGQGFLNGLLFFRLFLVLTLSIFVIKDLAFRLYSFYTILKTFNYWGYVNIAGPLFTDNPDIAKKIDFLFYNSATLGCGIFILVALIISKLPKWHSIIIYFILFSTVFIDVIIFFDYQWYWLKAGVYLIVFSSFYYIVLSVYCIIKQIAFAKFYAVPFIFGLLSSFFLYLRLLGWIEYQPLFSVAYYLFLGEIFVFVFFLGRIFSNTEQNKARTEQRLNFNLAQNTRLKELDNLKTRFFTNISHEFRTPLTLLVGPIDDLKNKYPQEGIISVMQRNIQRLQSLINQLLDLSKLEAGEMKINFQEVDLSQFLGQLFASFESLAQSKNIIFNYSQSHLTQLAKFDLDKLEKIITNLLSNAFKFTPKNGRISVRVEYEKNQVFLKIQDFGIGISPERLSHIFDRFYQVDESSLHDGTQPFQEGTGIGLSLVKELVDLLKGEIEVESSVGEGTSFTLTLPFESIQNLSKSASKFVSKNHSEMVYNELQSLNGHEVELDSQSVMLVVEDNPDLRNYIRSIFENQFRLVTAVDGQEGLMQAFEHIPDIIISDLMMPKLDGFGFCERIKSDERTNHIPVIMLTAKASIADKLIGLSKGADDYLSKPFNKEELTVRVNNLVNQRQLMREKYALQTVEVIPTIEVVKEPTIDDIFIQKAKEIVDKYLDKSAFDVENFANEMNMSSVQLRRKLKAITDQTVTEFVRNYRLEIASEMLKKKMGTVSEIAYKVGFDSMPYFSKVFLEKYGKTASEWK